MEGEVRVHTLNPNAVRISKSLGDAVGLTQLGVHMVTIMPDHESAEYHRHLYEEECAYVLSGNGLAVIDGKSFEITVGAFLGFPRRGAAHSISNNGSEPLVLLVAGQRLEHDVCEYPRKGKRLHMNGALEVLVDF
ncbi:MAG: cupin domain-containing protein [Rhodoferax sp.]|uniref:cupin domain-containing protein n=1 Tax=Rhodoferax sp. TaxID=50421 RepID=UPI00261B255A|nr:cupin domain-containing protein [Rhodoferax sp.]MDD5335222.1 cupin domain-containing protein [Rhodoferax sp.]